MAISADRLEQLRQEFIPVKNRIDQIDRKYSLDYKEPLMDMPESLDLVKLEYVEKSESELNKEAEYKTKAKFASLYKSLESRRVAKLANNKKQQQEVAEKARCEQEKYLTEFTRETRALRQKLIDHGMLFSSTIDRMTANLQTEYEQKVTSSNKSVEEQTQILLNQSKEIEKQFNAEEYLLDMGYSAQLHDEYNKLVESEKARQTSIIKYNSLLDEKEKKYQMARAKTLENAKQAEYNRSFAAKKLYQQMGATGYEQAMLWEKYNVFVSHFGSFTVREEALALIRADSYVSGHLKQYYNTLIDWVNRNVPA